MFSISRKSLKRKINFNEEFILQTFNKLNVMKENKKEKKE